MRANEKEYADIPNDVMNRKRIKSYHAPIAFCFTKVQIFAAVLCAEAQLNTNVLKVL